MFLTNTVNTQAKSLFEYNVELYEDIISFNEEYNNIKEDIILQEHSMLLEGNSLDYIQESISETASKIWEHIKQFLIKLKNKIVEVWNIVKKKVLEIIVKLKSFFNKGEDVVVVDIKEDVSKLQRLRAYVSNIGKVTKENIMEHKKAITAIVGVASAGALTYILWKNNKEGRDRAIEIINQAKVSKEVDGKSGLAERESELNIVNLDESVIARFAESIFARADALSKAASASSETTRQARLHNDNLRKENEADKLKAEVSMLAYLEAEEQKLKMNILKKAAYMKGIRGNTLSRRTSSREEINAYDLGRGDRSDFKKSGDEKSLKSFSNNPPQKAYM